MHVDDCEIDDWVNDIHQGDARDLPLPDNSVHCVVTSPSYFGLRDYGPEDQIGLEGSVDEYVRQMLEVGREIRRVLRPDGNWWLNIGDSFAGSWGAQSHTDETADGRGTEEYPGMNPARSTDVKRKSKLFVPHRVAIALTEDGWVARGDSPWVKTNYKPHPVKDRLVERKEFFFHLTPEPMYWWDLEAVREPHKESSLGRSESSFESSAKGSLDMPREEDRDSVIIDAEDALHPNGKNPGDVLEGTVSNYSGDHSATYPEWICEKPMKSSCPPKVCAECGMPFDRVVEEGNREVAGGTPSVDLDGAGYKDRTGNHEGDREGMTIPERELGGWKSGCECETDATRPGIVLDPFAGAGTTCVVGKRLGRRFIGFDLDPDSVAEAQKRVGVTVDEPERLLEDDAQAGLGTFAGGGVQESQR